MTRLECIKSNAFLLGLNMNNATKEQKIQWLCQIIDNETDKPEDETDFALIGECSAYLRELSDKAAEATKEQKQRILQQIKAHHNQTATAKSAKVLRPNWRKMGKIIVIAATVAALLLSTLTVLAKVNGYSSAWEYVKENAKTFFNLSPGSNRKENGITLTKHDGVVTYNSIEELLQAEGYDIMYPSELPEGVKITKILEQIVSAKRTVYCYQFTDIDISILASTQQTVFYDSLERYEVLRIEETIFYIGKTPEGIYQAVGYDGKYEYRICCSNYDMLIKILNGMKEIGK